MHACIHACVCASVRALVRAYVPACVRACASAGMRACMRLWCVCMINHVFSYISIYIYMYICSSACAVIWPLVCACVCGCITQCLQPYLSIVLSFCTLYRQQGCIHSCEHSYKLSGTQRDLHVSADLNYSHGASHSSCKAGYDRPQLKRRELMINDSCENPSRSYRIIDTCYLQLSHPFWWRMSRRL